MKMSVSIYKDTYIFFALICVTKHFLVDSYAGGKPSFLLVPF